MEQNQFHSNNNIIEQPGRRRCQSLNSLTSEDNGIDLTIYKPDAVHRTYSDSSVELCMHCDHGRLMDSGISDRMIDNDMLAVMEQKIDRLSDMFLEQCRLLTTMKEEIRSSKLMLDKAELAHNQIFVDILKKAIEQRLLQKELKDWRVKVTELLSSHFQPEPLETNLSDGFSESVDFEPITPPQPASQDVSVVDQLMQAALVNKLIEDGDVNGSFERALSAGDLSLVMVACRAVDPGQVFTAPCSLKQHVLMSLVQQLATDMLHETQLKSRFLEDAIINLDMANQDTRTHLPLVVGEVQKHLSKFLVAYPNHIASRRITMIVMAVNNLLK
ncbi:hypothetical protein HF086_007124 [Spodoptera exigua]|uniref:Enhancer of mRNA-decapping protein 4 C-terminal domain-containing protein n=1 Tax=Spodoptera exigua TaxID=7107 RepID=A0A922MHK1_SPOEX|nr:hypothetical protein HF086_007124 [Spodoptera exigua]